MSRKSLVYIGNLSYHASRSDVTKFFRGYGKISEVILKSGFGFAQFEDSRDADDVIHDLNGRSLMGERVVLQIAKGTPRGAGGKFITDHSPSRDDKTVYGISRGGYKVIVKNLSSSYDCHRLKRLMDKCGKINCVMAHHYRKNEAVVEFHKEEDMDYAVKKFDRKEVNGRELEVTREHDRYKLSKSPSPSKWTRSRSRSRS